MPTATGNVNTSSIFHKLKYRDMVRNYNPWNKKGAGAPNDDIRFRNMETDGIYPTPVNVPEAKSSKFLFDNFRNSLPRTNKQKNYLAPAPISGGGGDPIRSSSGKFLLSLHEDPSITFSNSTRNFVEQDLRYKKSPSEQRAYKQELDKLADEQRHNRYMERYGYSAPKIGDEPWGRPGPGGAPWRDPRNVGANFMKSMGWTTKDQLNSIYNDINEPPKKQKSPDRQIDIPPTKYNCCNRCTCECVKKVEKQYLSNPALSSHYDSDRVELPKRTHQPPHYARPQQCNRHIEFGPPTVQNLQQMSSNTQQHQPQQIQQVTSSKSKTKISPKKPSRTCMITGGVELVPLLAKRRDDRPISLSTTDITKYKINKSSWNDGGIEYLDSLSRQVEAKQQKRQLSKECDIELSRQHFDTWESFWGRPGCGAPQNNRNKQNLDDLLYNAPMYQSYQQY